MGSLFLELFLVRVTKSALTPGGHHGAFGRTFVGYWTLRVRYNGYTVIGDSYKS